jgi:hypothetical protein
MEGHEFRSTGLGTTRRHRWTEFYIAAADRIRVIAAATNDAKRQTLDATTPRPQQTRRAKRTLQPCYNHRHLIRT